MTETLTFENLPLAISQLAKEVTELKRLLIEKQEKTPTDQAEKWLDLNALIEYDPEKRTKPTWYSKISKGEVPYHKRGKKVYFLKSEIDNWLKAGRKQTFADVKAEADAYLSNNKLGLKHGK